MKISKIMSHPVITLNPSDTIQKALDLMKSNRIGSIVIIDEDNLPVNILTAKDFINLIDSDFHIDPNLKIEDSPFKKDLVTIFDTDSYDDALKLLTKNFFHHLIVINQSGAVVGILSTKDLMSAQEELNRYFPYFPGVASTE